MKLQDVEMGIIDYIHNEIAAKATGVQKFLIYTGSFFGATQVEKMISKYEPLLLQLGIITPEGDIDVEALYNAMKQGIDKSGKFEYMGIIFGKDDVESLFRYINARGGKNA